MPRGRPRKVESIVKTDAAEASVSTPQTNGTTADFTMTNAVLDTAKDRFTQVAIVGLTADGKLDIATNNPNFAFLQWILDRAKYALHVHEESPR